MTTRLVALLAGGCAFATPASDYFDGRGVETVAVIDGVEELVSSGPSLYVTDGTRVYRTVSDGTIDDAEELPGSTGVDVHGLSANANGLAAWCDATGLVWFAPDGGGTRRVPGSAPCDATAAGQNAINFLSADTTNATLRRLEIADGSMAQPVTLGPSQASPVAIYVTPDDVVVAMSAGGIVRSCLDGDIGCSKGLCRLSSLKARPNSRAKILASGSGASIRPLVVADQAELFAPTRTTCCGFSDESCALDAYRVRRAVSPGDVYAASGGQLFVLHVPGVSEVGAFSDPATDMPVAPGSTTARLLAIGRTHAFYVEGQKLQRAPLGVR